MIQDFNETIISFTRCHSSNIPKYEVLYQHGKKIYNQDEAVENVLLWEVSIANWKSALNEILHQNRPPTYFINLQLIEKYPVILSRHFMAKMLWCLLKIIKWKTIEGELNFINVVLLTFGLVVWIKDYSEFDAQKEILIVKFAVKFLQKKGI